MKKLIILCAALLAVTAFMASCKNSSDYIDVTKESYTYAYTVTGTIKTTTVIGSDANNTDTYTYVQTLNNATAIVSYDENKNLVTFIPKSKEEKHKCICPFMQVMIYVLMKRNTI